MSINIGKPKRKLIGTPLFISKTKLGLCKNDKCNGKRNNGSAYCEMCTTEHRKKQALIAEKLFVKS